MIEIRVTDPATCKPDELRLVANMLLAFAGDKAANVAKPALTAPVAADVKPATPIAPEDTPDAGTDAAEVFAEGGDPAVVFAQPAAALVPTPPSPNAAAATSQIANDAAASASATAPVTNPAPVPNGSTLDLDADGLPWDARIHASSKVKNADGRWRGRRGVDDSTVASVTAELRAVTGNAPVVGSPVASVPPPPVAAIPAPPSVAPELGNVPPPPPVTTAVPVPPAPVAAIETPPPAPGAATITFPILCAKITSALKPEVGTLTQERLGAVLAAHKLTGLPTLAAFPHLWPVVAAELGFA